MPRRRSGDRRRWAAIAVGLVLTAIVVAVVIAATAGSNPPPPAPAPPADRVARGLVRPIHQARVGTLAGGVVGDVVVQVGQTVANQQPLARVRTAGGVELLTAPWRGTVTNLAIGRGDTVAPGTTLVTIADLSRLEIETTDLDEFLIVHIVPGQIVSVTVEAFDAPAFSAVIRTIAPKPGPIGRATITTPWSSIRSTHRPICAPA